MTDLKQVALPGVGDGPDSSLILKSNRGRLELEYRQDHTVEPIVIRLDDHHQRVVRQFLDHGQSGTPVNPPDPQVPIYEFTQEKYPAEDEAELAQAIFDSGLLFMANTAVFHHFGYALAADVDDDDPMTVTGLALLRTDDPDGIWFDEELIVKGRRRIRTLMRRLAARP